MNPRRGWGSFGVATGEGRVGRGEPVGECGPDMELWVVVVSSFVSV